MITCASRVSSPSKFSPDFMISKVLRATLTVLLMANMLPMATTHIAILENIKLINENSTIVHPLMNLTQNATQSIEKTDLGVLPWWCHYSSDLEENENESECHCEGPKLMKIPQNLPQITRLSIANAKFKVLREAGLRKYSSSLRDL